MLTNPEKYWFDGKIIKDEECRTGYAGQFCVREKMQDCTVFEYLSRRFTELPGGDCKGLRGNGASGK